MEQQTTDQEEPTRRSMREIMAQWHERYFVTDMPTMAKRVTDDLIIEFADYIDEYVGFVAALPKIKNVRDCEYVLLDDSHVVNCLSALAVPEIPILKLMIEPNVDERIILRSPAQRIDHSSINHIRRITLKEGRGRVKRILPFMFEFTRYEPLRPRANFSIYLGFLPDRMSFGRHFWLKDGIPQRDAVGALPGRRDGSPLVSIGPDPRHGSALEAPHRSSPCLPPLQTSGDR